MFEDVRRSRLLRIRTACAAVVMVAAALAGPAGAQDPPGLAAPPAPVDPQSWVLPDQMTWDDYRPIPGINWNDASHQPAKKLRAALILGDFSDQPFIATQAEGSDLAGNPQGTGAIPRTQVANFYKEFLLTTPQPLNNFHTANEYWLENSYGLIGIDADAFGPYMMDFKEYRYGMNEFGQNNANDCPESSCGEDFDTELVEKSLADVTAGIVTNGGRDYDFRFLLHSGYDESGVWQEFGEMRFQTRDDVPDAFGNPNPTKRNWAVTRYIPWTSWWAARGIWSHAVPGVLSTQGESDGASTYAHEFSHILGVLDNYNNPYGIPVRRSYSGPWDMLSRGTFNGPGGPHNRWQIPPTLGGTMGSHHMLRNKIRMGFSKPGEVVFLERGALARTGPLAFDILPRALPLGPQFGRTGLHGIHISMPDGDKSPSCSVAQDWRCDGGGYNNYTVEVVDRIGYDSFAHDHGVLIAKNKNADTAPFIWVADAHPEDFNLVDFNRPDGTQAMISKGDYRQLGDALFHAGTGPDVASEYVDQANRLHFYVLGTNRDAQGVLTYRVGVRSLDGAGPFTRGVSLADAAADPAAPGRVAVYRFRVGNTGQGTDFIRLAANTAGGWSVAFPHRVIELGAGASVEVPVYVTIPEDAVAGTSLSFTVTSETDPAKTATSTRSVDPA